MGYLFQNFGLLENQSIKENLDLGFVGQKISKVERLERQVGALEKVNLGYLDLEQKSILYLGRGPTSCPC